MDIVLLLKNRMNRDRIQALSLFLAVVLLAASTAWIGRGVYRLGYLQMDMDEAIHANRGLDFALSLSSGDLQDAWHNLTKPHWYPPGNGVFLGLWFLALGASVETARLYSTLFFFLFGFLLWSSVREIIPEVNPLIYLIAILFLISDPLHTVYAGLSMLELPAMTFSFAALLYLNRVRRNNNFLDHVLALTFTLLCLFTKYNYGLVLVVIMFVSYLIFYWDWFRSDHRSGELLNILAVWLLFVLVLGIWFIGLRQWRWLFDYAGAQPDRFFLWSRGNLWYYPRLLVKNPLSLLAIVLSIGGAITLFKRRQFAPELAPYLMFFAISLIMLTIELQNSPRFGIMLSPPLWITATVGAGLLIAGLNRRWLRDISLAMLLSILFLAGLVNFRSFMSRLYAEHENANEGVNEAYHYISSVLDVAQKGELHVVMVGRTDQWNGVALGFHLNSICAQSGMDCEVTTVDTREIRRGWPEQDLPLDIQEERMRAALAQADVIIHFFENPEHPQGWNLVSEREFTFERQYKKSKQVWVSIYKQ